MGHDESSYRALRDGLWWEPGPGLGTMQVVGSPWDLSAIGPPADDHERALHELRLCWGDQTFRWFVSMLPILLVDPDAQHLVELSNGVPGRRRRARLVRFLLDNAGALPGDPPPLFSQMLLQRLLFYDLWHLYVQATSASPSREDPDRCRDECRQAQRNWIGSLRGPDRGPFFEAWLVRWRDRYGETIGRLMAAYKHDTDLLFPVSAKADVEHEVSLALFECPDTGHKLRFADDRADFVQVDSLVRDWYLRRYDLLGASRAMNSLCHSAAGETMATGALKRFRAWLLPGLGRGQAVLAAVTAALAWLAPIAGLSELAALARPAGACAPPARLAAQLPGPVGPLQRLAPWLFALFIAAAIVWFASLALRFSVWGKRALYLHVPRLAAATLLGLGAGLLNISGFGEFALRAGDPANLWLSLLLVGGSLALAFFYLHWEVGTPALHPDVQTRRVCCLMALGCTQAITFSSLFSWLLADRLFDSCVLTQAPRVQLGWPFTQMGLGHYYPTLALLFAFTSLAVGVVLQTLWQEQPMTDPEVALR